MSNNSNQGPPDLDVAFRELFSSLFKKRDQRKKSPKRDRLKQVLEQAKKKQLEKQRKSGRTVARIPDDKRAQVQLQRQHRETRTVPKPQVETVDSESEITIEQRIAAHQQSRTRPSEPIKADKLMEQNVSANSSRQWLHDPRALRQAFVLKELLEPPVALRKRDRRRFS